MGLPELKSRRSFLEAPGEDLSSCLTQLLEATRVPSLMVPHPFSWLAAISQAVLVLLHSALPCVYKGSP